MSGDGENASAEAPGNVRKLSDAPKDPRSGGVRVRVLVPLTVTLLLLLGGYALRILWLAERQAKMHCARVFNAVPGAFQRGLDREADMMAAVLEAIAGDDGLRSAFVSGDGNELLSRTGPLFARLRQRSSITHFYFLDPNRVCLLRLHQPARRGDMIDRFTTRQAEKTGRLAHGIELGPLGTFALRVVWPWFENGRLIGYLELGVDIEHITELLHEALGVEFVVAIHKEFLDRTGWQEGMAMLGRDADWDRFPDSVVISRTVKDIPEELGRRLAKGRHGHDPARLEVSMAGRDYHAHFLELEDAGGRQVGDMVILRDVTARYAAFRRIIVAGSLIRLAVGAGLFGFFYVFLGRVDRDLTRHSSALAAANERLRAARDHLRITLASIGDGVIATDVHGRVTQLNKVAEALTGWTSEKARGRPLQDVFNIVNEETRALAEDPAARAIATGHIQGLANHTVLIARDGAERAIADSAAPIQDPSGRTVGVVVVFRDVTGKRQQQRERERLVRDLSERVKELNCLYGLSKIVERPGITLEGILEAAVGLLPAAWQYHETACGRIRYEDQVFETDDCLRGPSCQSADICAHGRRVGAVEVCYRGDRPEADEGPFLEDERALLDALAERLGRIIERKTAEKALVDSEKKHRTLLENLPQKIFYKNRDSVYVSCNLNYARGLGIEPEQVAGKTDYEFYRPELAEKYRTDDRRIVESGKIEEIEEKYEQDGQEFTVQTVKIPVTDVAGNVVGVLGIFWDISQRKQVEEELRATVQDLDRFNRAAVNRETRMIELKREVNEMARKAGVAPPYDLAFAESCKEGTDDEA